MRENEFLKIVSEKVELVPYQKKYVEKYHLWMTNQYLLDMTASDPLTLEEEYDMQQSWRDDQKKLTFIILIKNDETNSKTEIDRMAGDINLFLNDYDDDKNAEIDIMIAEEKYRRGGLAKETLYLMMNYGIKTLGIHRFYAKINEVNEPSIKLFLR